MVFTIAYLLACRLPPSAFLRCVRSRLDCYSRSLMRKRCERAEKAPAISLCKHSSHAFIFTGPPAPPPRARPSPSPSPSPEPPAEEAESEEQPSQQVKVRVLVQMQSFHAHVCLPFSVCVKNVHYCVALIHSATDPHCCRRSKLKHKLKSAARAVALPDAPKSAAALPALVVLKVMLRLAPRHHLSSPVSVHNGLSVCLF